ncbi:hypothetical protein VCHA53O466_140044 [Vibrio chagasii]|nr:hypothetical protein VCHA53O466_140044 [Vibrio chagasii]
MNEYIIISQTGEDEGNRSYDHVDSTSAREAEEVFLSGQPEEVSVIAVFERVL